MKRTLAPLLCALLAATSAVAAETLSYTYDQHGRLTKVQRSGGNNPGVTTQYSYDPSDNRTNAWQNSGSPPTPPAARPPAFSISDASVLEIGALSFTVTRHGSFAPPASFSVNYATANGTATAGSDYTAGSGTLNFGADDYVRTVTVQTTHDTSAEGDELLAVNLSGATGGATIVDSQGIGMIVDDDSSNQPPVAVTDYAEGELCGSGILIVATANDTDPDGNYPLAVVQIVSTSSGSAIFQGPYVGFYPSVPGTATIVYRVQDSAGANSTGTIYVNVIGQGPCS